MRTGDLKLPAYAIGERIWYSARGGEGIVARKKHAASRNKLTRAMRSIGCPFRKWHGGGSGAASATETRAREFQNSRYGRGSTNLLWRASRVCAILRPG